MVEVPEFIPVNIPEDEMFVTRVLLQDQLPPVLASLKLAGAPEHTVERPVTGAGLGLTVTSVEVLQPVDSVKVILAEPTETPVITPVAEPAVAIAELLLAQVPVAESCKVVE
jgi:hypothetical protein